MQPGVYYGFYFLELAEYFGQEGNDETQMLNLLYVTMNAIRRGKQDLRLIRCIFALRTITISGEAPQMFSCMAVSYTHLYWKRKQRSCGSVWKNWEEIPDTTERSGRKPYTGKTE